MGETYEDHLELHQQGDGVDLPLVKARGAERHGVIWMLAASLAAAFVALVGFWLLNHPQFSQLM
jgi:hypothetical protein